MSLLAPLLALFALFLGVTGCSSGPTAPPLPAAPDLLAKSASAMAAVRTVAIDVQVERSEERRVGKECTIQCRSRWSPYH